MSNSIWKTPGQKQVNDNDIVIISDKACFIGHFDEFHGFYIRHSSGCIYGTDDIDRWSTLDDLVAQADKAERLQKAVDYAIETLKFYADKRHYNDKELDLMVYEWRENEETGVLDLDDGGCIENGKKARDTIKQLTKGE